MELIIESDINKEPKLNLATAIAIGAGEAAILIISGISRFFCEKRKITPKKIFRKHLLYC